MGTYRFAVDVTRLGGHRWHGTGHYLRWQRVRMYLHLQRARIALLMALRAEVARRGGRVT